MKYHVPSEVMWDVVDHVNDRPTLSRICVSSKELQKYATPRLYSHMVLHVGSFSEFIYMQMCINRGARTQMERFTQHLTFKDAQPQKRSNQNFNKEESWLGSTRCTSYDIGLLITAILEIIKPGRLLTFRFLSRRDLKEDVFRHLLLQQKNIQHLEVPTRDAYPIIRSSLSEGRIPCFFPALRVIDLSFRSTRLFSAFIKRLVFKPSTADHNIQCLRISVDRSIQEFSAIFCQELERERSRRPTQLSGVRMLSLSGFNLHSLFPAARDIFKVHSLVSIVLWNCSGAAEFLLQIGREYRNTKIALKQLAAVIEMERNTKDAALQGVYRICHLTSLHLSWKGEHDDGPETTIRHMPVLATSLRSLTLYNDSDLQSSDLVEYQTPFLRSWEGCNKLRQLAVQVKDSLMDISNWRTSVDTWRELRHLPALSLLHLHNTSRKTEDELLIFVDRLFLMLSHHHFCPQLRAVVIDSTGNSRNRFNKFRHCFIKSSDAFVDIHPTIYARSVSTISLREVVPESDILDLDSVYHWPGGGAPGQFHSYPDGGRRFPFDSSSY
ncbi:hypothetical protein BS50DRAFT_595019 [Corynespora cassiicola Philippines]|uniref:Uncharacterized protein n=1 Tax=Corynespora cassiicola Philippines TaxID=1448308 RepID=A0A2T2N0L1_CORCC|nr:hypothetical protein BS50DRAFT_595019 [Corynespora cassiicola Philippines]